MTTNFTKVWYPELLANASAVLTYPEIACVPLKYILSAIDVKHIDVWVLDVEGAEEKALLGTGNDCMYVCMNACMYVCMYQVHMCMCLCAIK
jgi:hypothetical protein